MTTPPNPWALPDPHQDPEPETTAFPAQSSKDAWGLREEEPVFPSGPVAQPRPAEKDAWEFVTPAPAMPVQQESKSFNAKPVIMTVAALLALALIGGLGFVGVKTMAKKRASTQAPVVVTQYVDAPGQKSTDKPGSKSNDKPSAEKPKPAIVPVPAPGGASFCGDSGGFGVYAGTYVTSCPFALNVGSAMSANAKSDKKENVVAASPVTGQSYSMECTVRGSAGNFSCTGGDNALVYLVAK